MAIDIGTVLTVAGTVAGISGVLGGGLAIASQIFAVEVDERITRVGEVLPGVNCGACGFPGCSGYASAVVEDPNVPANLCSPGGASVADKIGEITGKSAGASVKMVAILRCVQDQSKGSPEKYEYHGLKDCASVEVLHQGAFLCPFACVGLGTCAEICPVSAITMDKGRPQIDSAKCTGCGMCVKICPRHVLQLAVSPGRVQVYCRNTNPPKVKRKMCVSACIGCSLCVKKCPYQAIKMENFVAVVDHGKCPPDCPRPCIEKCPTSAILAR